MHIIYRFFLISSSYPPWNVSQVSAPENRPKKIAPISKTIISLPTSNHPFFRCKKLAVRFGEAPNHPKHAIAWAPGAPGPSSAEIRSDDAPHVKPQVFLFGWTNQFILANGWVANHNPGPIVQLRELLSLCLFFLPKTPKNGKLRLVKEGGLCQTVF